MSTLEQIHPALIDSCTEFFDAKNNTYHLCNGMTEKSNILSQTFSRLLEKELDSDLKAQKSLTQMGITEKLARVKKFYDCNYSAFDNHPDITKDGALGPREYVKCGLREGICAYENKLCRNPMSLSNRETQIGKRIALGDGDTKICIELFISENTLRNHKNSIEFKIDRKGKTAIAGWFIENKIV
jgi:DNA-binding CsgD family transcriptional regulator